MENNITEHLAKHRELIKANIYEMAGGEAIDAISEAEFNERFIEKGFSYYTDEAVRCYIDDITKSEDNDGLVDEAKVTLGTLEKVFVKSEADKIHAFYVQAPAPEAKEEESEEGTK